MKQIEEVWASLDGRITCAATPSAGSWVELLQGKPTGVIEVDLGGQVVAKNNISTERYWNLSWSYVIQK